MTEYCNNEFLVCFFKDAGASQGLLTHIVEGVERYTPYRVWDRWLSPQGRAAILNLSEHAAPAAPSFLDRVRASCHPAPPLQSNRVRVRTRMAVLQAGYTTADRRSWERSLRRVDDQLRCDDAGGIAAFCAVFFDDPADEQIFLWSTRPALRALASAENAELIVAGTRPRLVHRVACGFGRVALDREYIRGALAGWSLSQRTPYEGTSLLPVDVSLRLRQGARTLHDHPTAPYERSMGVPLRIETRRYRQALREAVEPLRRLSGFELRLSGGKDSRLVAAALRDRRIVPSTTVCHGLPGEWEGPVAERVARALGWPIKFVVPEFCHRGGLLETVKDNMRLADGWLATEPLQVSYPQYGMSGDRGPGLAMGHIELQRGGWAKRMRADREEILRAAHERLTPFRDCVVPALSEAAAAQLADYVQRTKVSSEAELPYWINYRFRVCRWLTSHFLVHSRVALPVYPLLDEKVVRVISTAPLEQLVSERLVFSTMRAMAPELTRLPLFKERYRFEAHKPAKSFREFYEERAPVGPAPSTYHRRELTLADGLRATLCEYIREGKLQAELKDATRREVWATIERPARSRIEKANVPNRQLSSYLWTCFQASVLFTEEIGE